MGRYFIKDFNRHLCGASAVAFPSSRATSGADEVGLNFPCPYGCGRSFTSKRGLTNHGRSHERRGERVSEVTSVSATNSPSVSATESLVSHMVTSSLLDSAGNPSILTSDGLLGSCDTGSLNPSIVCNSPPNPLLSMLESIDSSPPTVLPTPVVSFGEVSQSASVVTPERTPCVAVALPSAEQRLHIRSSLRDAAVIGDVFPASSLSPARLIRAENVEEASRQDNNTSGDSDSFCAPESSWTLGERVREGLSPPSPK